MQIKRLLFHLRRRIKSNSVFVNASLNFHAHSNFSSSHLLPFLLLHLDRMELLFRSVDRYWPLQNVNQNLNISGNATSHPQFQMPMTGVTQHMTFASGGVLHFGIVNDSCITALNLASCPNGMTVSFWLRLLKNPSITHPLKILGFGKTNETKRGFLVMQHQDNVVIWVTWRNCQCETTFDIINGSWANIVFTLRGSTFEVYLNGEDLGSSTCADIMNSDVEQKLTSGHAVAAIGELMFWYRRYEKKTVSKMFRYGIGKMTQSKAKVVTM